MKEKSNIIVKNVDFRQQNQNRGNFTKNLKDIWEQLLLNYVKTVVLNLAPRKACIFTKKVNIPKKFKIVISAIITATNQKFKFTKKHLVTLTETLIFVKNANSDLVLKLF